MISGSVPMRSGGIFDYAGKKDRLEEVSRELENPEIWNTPAIAQELGRERAHLDSIVGTLDRVSQTLLENEEKRIHFLQLIKEAGLQAGLVFNPATPLHYLDYVMDKIDMVLIMSVNPGFGGQSFIPSALDKLRDARQRIDASGRDIRLEVDGGVKVDNIREIAEAGADTFVAGSAIFNADDYSGVIRQMRSELAGL